MRKYRWLAVVAAVLLTGACGGGTAGPGTGEATSTTAATSTVAVGADAPALRTALARSAEATSGRMEGRMEVFGLEGTPAGTNLEMTWSGAFDNAAGTFTFTMDLGSILEQAAAQGEEIPPEMAGMFDEMEMRVVGDTAYLRFPFFSAFLGVDTEWLSMPADEGRGATGSFSFGANPANPADLLSVFEDLDAAIEVVGRANTRGVATTHYRVQVDVQSLMEQADPEQLEQLEELGPLPIDELPLDLWIDNDGLVRKFAMDFDGSELEAPEGEGFERMVMTFEIFDFGQPVAVQPPPASQVTDVSELDFNPFADAT